MRIYIIRHADPDYVNNTITPAGHLEAEALSRRLAKEGLTDIISSPMGRAMHTMEYTAEKTGLKPVIEPWTAEMNGWKVADGSGKEVPAWNIHGEWIRKEYPVPTTTNWHQKPYFDHPSFQEKYRQLQADSDRFLSSYGYERQDGRYKIVEPNRKRLAVFCHHGFGTAWLAHLLELPLSVVWSGFFLPPSSVTTLIMDERTSEWATPRCIGLGDTSHLYEAGLPISKRGIVANFD